MEIVLLVIIWICVVVFAVTCLVTLLGITNKIKIRKEYLDKLFYSLIIEIVVICVGIFGNMKLYINGRENFSVENDKLNIVTITDPLMTSASYPVPDHKTIYLSGAFFRAKEQYELIGYYENNQGQITKISDMRYDPYLSNVFRGSFMVHENIMFDTLKIYVGLVEEKKSNLLENDFIVQSSINLPIHLNKIPITDAKNP